MLPEEILKEAQEEFLNWRNTGMSILEIGHRTPEIISLLSTAEQSLRELLNIPKNYHVLFLGGAARAQFAMIPMNLLRPGDDAAYFITGIWSKMAYHEANLLKKHITLAVKRKKDLYQFLTIKSGS